MHDPRNVKLFLQNSLKLNFFFSLFFVLVKPVAQTFATDSVLSATQNIGYFVQAGAIHNSSEDTLASAQLFLIIKNSTFKTK